MVVGQSAFTHMSCFGGHSGNQSTTSTRTLHSDGWPMGKLISKISAQNCLMTSELASNLVWLATRLQRA